MSQYVDSIHRLFRDNSDEIDSWLADVQQLFSGWKISQGSIAMLEREGVYLAEHEKQGVGVIVGILLDITLHMQKYSSPRSAFHEVYNHAVETWRTNHISRVTGMHPQALSQFNNLMQHIKKSSGAA